MFAKFKVAVLSLTLAGLLAPRAMADSFGISFGKNGPHNSFGVSFSTGDGCVKPAPPACVPCAPGVWVPAHYETVLQNVWVEGCQQQIWVGPTYKWGHDVCGHPYKVQVSSGHWQTVGTPGHYESRRVEVWQPAHWEAGGYHTW